MDGMTDAVDILSIAAGLKHQALERFHATQAVQASPAAGQAYEAAWLGVALASADMERAQRVAAEITSAKTSR